MVIVDPPLLRCQWWLTLRLLQAFQYGRWVTFQQWVATLITERFGTQTALANAIGLQLTPFTRGVAVGTFNVMNLLRLARAAEASPSMVLRLAGKGQEADLIEELYGSGRDALTASQREVVALWDQITEERRAPLLFTMRVYAAAAEGGARPGGGREESPLRRAARRTTTPRAPRGRRPTGAPRRDD